MCSCCTRTGEKGGGGEIEIGGEERRKKERGGRGGRGREGRGRGREREGEGGEKESRRVWGWRILGHSREISSWKWLKISMGKYRINCKNTANCSFPYKDTIKFLLCFPFIRRQEISCFSSTACNSIQCGSGT